MNLEPVDRQPLHRRVAHQIREIIRGQLQPGQRIEAEDKLAITLGVSVRTVREALGALAHEGLVERRHGSGTYVTEKAAARWIGLWFRVDPSLSRADYGWQVLSQTQSFLRKHGAPVKVYSACCTEEELETDPTCLELVRDLEQLRLSGFSFVHGWAGERVTALVQRADLPVIANQPFAGHPYAVGLDPTAMIRHGTQHLLSQGCRRIAWMGWLGLREGRSMKANYETFRSVLAQGGAKTRDEWIRGDLHPTLTGAGYEQFREIWMSSDIKPDGLLVSDDVLFQDVVAAIHEIGIAVPDQLKVIAHANKGAVTCPFFPAGRMMSDAGTVATALGEMLLRTSRGELTMETQVVVPYEWSEGPVVGDVSRIMNLSHGAR